MKKFILLFLLFLNINYIYAIENIEINNEFLIPMFDKNIKEYNYFTSSDIIDISVVKTSNESVYGDGKHNIIDDKSIIKISSSLNEEYYIKVFKNYKKDNNKGYLESLSIDGYDINFDRNNHTYYIHINNERSLNINYKLSNDNCIFSISGNGNFNKSDNIITISVNDEVYFIHVIKSKSVSYVSEEKKENMSKEKKEVTIIILIIIASSLVSLYFYSLFIFN